MADQFCGDCLLQLLSRLSRGWRVGDVELDADLSDVPVDVPAGIAFTLRDERTLRTRTHFDAVDALAAAGLSERAGRGS